MDALCVRCRGSAWERDRIRIIVLVLVVVILAITAVKGWTLTDVVAVITAAFATSAAAAGRRTAS
jgi:hypothetical protein